LPDTGGGDATVWKLQKNQDFGISNEPEEQIP
jgi:hypothetical protein